MTEDSDTRVYDVEVVYRDAGIELQFRMDDWMEMVETDFTSFEVLKGTFRTDREAVKERLREGWTEVDDDEEREDEPDEPRLRLKNPPKEWVDDPAEAADVYDAYNVLLARMGLYVLMENELEAQDVLIENGQYKATVVRQSAFFEELLTFQSQLAFQEQKGGILSSKEINVIEQMSHRDRLRLAHLFGVIDEDEHGLLQEMATWRNDIAHTSWEDFESQEEAQIESTAKRVRDLLQHRIDQSEEFLEDVDETQTVGEFIGFEALETDLQLLQIAILTVLDARRGSARLSDLQEIIEADPDVVEQRCNRMHAVGYIERDNEEIQLTDYGQEFYENEIA